ncbi:TetR/AcrR family transcriptional regulator [Pseudonocardia sp. TRM90224]|uniref:TetR/AcrR family transcriptional regulator n=1 Tax=Pseudonocardia sp. TRM90224 TaxID=2812678 RepID=UPI001E4B26C0|nr:TetR/AcrR family transcriptional regulator [Pseudonocardia sp. TRM90224]
MVGGDRVRRDQLVAAAYARVAEVGFEGLRLRQVAGDVGIDHSTLHHHIATKQELVEAVAAYTTSRFFGTSPPGSGLRDHLRNLRQLMVEDAQLFTVTAELDLRAQRDPAVAGLMRRIEEGWREALIELLLPHVTDPAADAELVIAVVKGARFAPQHAQAVFDRLEDLLLGSDSNSSSETSSENKGETT